MYSTLEEANIKWFYFYYLYIKQNNILYIGVTGEQWNGMI